LGLAAHGNALPGIHIFAIDRRMGAVRRNRMIPKHETAGFGRYHRALNTITGWSVQRLTASVEATVHDTSTHWPFGKQQATTGSTGH